MPRPDSYTRYPRPVLWLVAGGELARSGAPGGLVPVASFYLAQHPTTNQQFEAFDPTFTRAPHSPGDGDTAAGVSCVRAESYCRSYAAIARKAIRLPTEIVWELACRGGTSGRFFWGDDEQAGDPYLFDRRTTAGGRLPPAERLRSNPLGLYGMLGGVWEWTEQAGGRGGGTGADSASPGDPGAAEPPEGMRVLRGGSFRLDRAEFCCATRRLAPPTLGAGDVGFRIARSFP